MHYFVRHGETDINAQDGINKFDTPLNNKGRAQVSDAAKKLHGLDIKRFYASDTLRTQQTAEIINNTASLNLPIQLDERLREFGMGDYEGKAKMSDLRPKFNVIYANPEEYGIESLQSVFARVHSFFKEQEELDVNEKVCVVCHGGVMHMICYAYSNDEFDAKQFAKMSGKSYNNAEILELDLSVPRSERKK